ncbi:hypothetical protein [Nostoc sp.]|uniref:hypothetical protein n=1 Tax=Nostoc sp. TaxID=1180 RepID=UPI002FF8CB70
MKSLRTLAPTILGLLTLTVTHPVNAQAVIDTLDNGNLSVTGMRSGSGCTVLFNPQGEIIQQGQSCRSTEVRKAQTAIDSYLQEQRTSDDHNGNRQPEAGTTVSRLSDLVGARAGQAENTVKERGYRWVKSDDSGYSYWLEGETNYCVTVKTDQGRYQSIIYTGGPVDCQN